MRTLGATVVDFPIEGQLLRRAYDPDQQAGGNGYDLPPVHNAAEYNADAIVTLCPMCQLNLDAYQGDVNKMFNTNLNIPVLYFTQLMGLAFGVAPEKLGLGKEFVDARPALSQDRRRNP